MRAGKYFVLGLILGIGLTWGWMAYSGKNKTSEPVLPALTTASSHAPFSIIYDFYHALDEGREDRIAALVTPEYWQTMKNAGFLQTWRQRRQQDPSLRFVFFLLNEQETDLKNGIARARGRAEWMSARQGNLSITQTITLVLSGGSWKIKDIKEEY